MIKSFVMLAGVLMISHFTFAQHRGVFVKFESKKYKHYGITVYANGLSRPEMFICSLGNIFWRIACDSSKAIELFPEVDNYYNKPTFKFSIPGKFHCGDSIVVDVDKSQIRFVNKNRTVNPPQVKGEK